MEWLGLELTERETIGFIVGISIVYLVALFALLATCFYYIKNARGPREKSFVIKLSVTMPFLLILYLVMLLKFPSSLNTGLSIVAIVGISQLCARKIAAIRATEAVK